MNVKPALPGAGVDDATSAATGTSNCAWTCASSSRAAASSPSTMQAPSKSGAPRGLTPAGPLLRAPRLPPAAAPPRMLPRPPLRLYGVCPAVDGIGDSPAAASPAPVRSRRGALSYRWTTGVPKETRTRLLPRATAAADAALAPGAMATRRAGPSGVRGTDAGGGKAHAPPCSPGNCTAGVAPIAILAPARSEMVLIAAALPAVAPVSTASELKRSKRHASGVALSCSAAEAAALRRGGVAAMPCQGE